MAILKGDARVEEYRIKAQASAQLAEAATLDHARQQHAAAAAAWTALADAEESRATSSRIYRGPANIRRHDAETEI